jgi:hypothetical protein
MKLLALLLALGFAGIASASFGEFAGQLNFTIGLTAPQSLTWGIMNTYNHTLNVSLAVAPTDYSPNIYSISISPSNIELNASTILYANVTATATGQALGSWSGQLIATAAPQGNQTGEVSIALSTIKDFSVTVTDCPRLIPVSPYSGIIGFPCGYMAIQAQLKAAGIIR